MIKIWMLNVWPIYLNQTIVTHGPASLYKLPIIQNACQYKGNIQDYDLSAI